MKPMFFRLFLVAFFAVAGLMRSNAQTTVTLPTIPCATCNGPGSFSTTAPACTPSLQGAPMTMSWGTAAGATTYTIMIATDAAMTQNVAAYTQTGTTLSVPAIALMPSTTYYWTVLANNATGSTRATSGVCSFITNTSWTGVSPTSGFPNGTPSQKMQNDALTGGYWDCRSSDGKCASGDNLLCNPNFVALDGTQVPGWVKALRGGGSGCANTSDLQQTIESPAAPNGVATVANWTTSGTNTTEIAQFMYINNTNNFAKNYRLRFWGKNGVVAASFRATGVDFYNFTAAGPSTTITLASIWTYYDVTISVNANTKAGRFSMMGGSGDTNFTSVWLCEL